VATTIRTFVAVELPEDHRRLLTEHLRRCAGLAPGYRWVTPDSLHLTLRFLGNLQPAALEAVRDRLDDVRAAPFRLALDGRGVFGPRATPRVVWLGVEEGRDACAALAASVEDACRAAGMGPEERPFRAHVTLARQLGERERLPALPDPPGLVPWTVEDFVLYESRLRQQPRYVPLARYRLTDSASG
jgi:RNA 2',3'-cyclic 3'-phosphodiesterase